MAGEAYEEAGLGRVALLGPGEGPDDDLVQHGTGTEQGTAVEDPAGDLHKRSSLPSAAFQAASDGRPPSPVPEGGRPFGPQTLASRRKPDVSSGRAPDLKPSTCLRDDG
jgi:hypothetical protein